MAVIIHVWKMVNGIEIIWSTMIYDFVIFLLDLWSWTLMRSLGNSSLMILLSLILIFFFFHYKVFYHISLSRGFMCLECWFLCDQIIEKLLDMERKDWICNIRKIGNNVQKKKKKTLKRPKLYLTYRSRIYAIVPSLRLI